MVHEWALAEAIVEYIAKESVEKGTSAIKKLVIKLGLLQGVERDILDFALRELLKSKGLSIDSIEYVDEAVVLKCRRCSYEWRLPLQEIDSAVREAMHFIPEVVYSYFSCPNCGSRDYSIVRGRGVSIERIEWEK